MKRSLIALVCGFCLLGVALADDTAAARPEATPERGTESATQKIERGVDAAGQGIKRGAEAAANGIKAGVSATERGIRRGAEATSEVLHKVADKISPSSGD